MKRIIAAAGAMLLAAALAAAETAVPGFDDFSPAFRGIGNRIASGETVLTETRLTTAAAFYIRDLSVMRDIFSGLCIRTRTGTDAGAQITELALLDGETVLEEAALCSDGEEQLLFLDGQVLHLGQETLTGLVPHGIPDALGVRRTDRLPALPAAWPERFGRLQPEGLSALLEGGSIGSFTCTPVSSEDGLLTGFGFSGQLNAGLLPGGEAWSAEGSFSRGTGKAPKDTAELTLKKDDDNALTLTFSAQYKASEQKKGEQGTLTRTTRARLSGKLGGYALDAVLELKEKNAWKLKEGALAEKITVSAKLDWQDKTPAHSTLRLGNGSVTIDEELGVSSSEGEANAWTDSVALKLYMNGEKTIDGKAESASRFDAGLPAFPEGEAAEADGTAFAQAVRNAAKRVARAVYSRLGPKSQGTITKGL
ncbi:MAG: hypothetical protein IJ573_03905 [Clostridia bacterium]|nr:hypothetical protein [Clostridia bacterium]